MSSLTAEAVRALAPDAGALKAGQSLGDPRHWTGLGHSERAAWGACKGSGAEPYAVSIDLSGPVAKCSCPSRKFPCKHGLGLMFLSANGLHGPVTPEPDAVAAWLEDRKRRATASTTREAGPATDERTAKARERDRERRTAQREERVAEGMTEFRRWLQDLARRGLADVADPGPYEAAAARLVDAQAGELARDVRALARVVAREGVGAEAVLDRVGLLSLVTETFQRREGLDPRLAAELRTRIGWTIREADLPPETDVTDRWLVVARRHEDDERLRETRTWLRGVTSGRWLMLLDFAPNRTEASNEPPVGAVIEGAVGVYPGASALRGALRPGWQPVDDRPMIEASADLAAALASYAAAVGTDPFLERWPLAVRDMRIAWQRQGPTYALVDSAGMRVPTRFAPASLEALVAFAGGHPVTVAGEWDGHALDVLAASDGATWIALPGTETVAVPADTGRAASDQAPTDAMWEALTAWATLGTGRGAPDPVLEPLLARSAGRPAEDQLLALMTGLSVRRRVARGPQPAPADLGRLGPAPEEQGTRPPASVALALREPVRRELRDERLRTLRSAGWIVPPELLPSEPMSPPVPDPGVLGERASWLARHTTGYRPWGTAVAIRDTVDAVARLEDEATTPAERQALFRSFRRLDPATARTWLAAAWDGLSAPDKQMVVAMEEGVSADDVPFLEGLLEERSRERRAAVVTMLSTIPSSAVAQRVRDRGRSLLARKNRLQSALRLIEPPDELYSALEADGHLVSTHQWKGGPLRSSAERAWDALDWHLQRVEPRAWCEWLGLSVGQLVEELTRLAARPIALQPGPLAGLGLSSGALASASTAPWAVAVAAVRFRDLESARMLLDDGYLVPVADELWAILPAADRPALAARIIRRRPTGYDGADALSAALRAIRDAWDQELRAIAEAELRDAIGSLGGRDRWAALARLRAFALEVPVDLLPGLVEGLLGQDGNPLDILDIAESRRRFAALVADARGAV